MHCWQKGKPGQLSRGLFGQREPKVLKVRRPRTLYMIKMKEAFNNTAVEDVGRLELPHAAGGSDD